MAARQTVSPDIADENPNFSKSRIFGYFTLPDLPHGQMLALSSAGGIKSLRPISSFAQILAENHSTSPKNGRDMNSLSVPESWNLVALSILGLQHRVFP
jgi:hypothetical protein